MVGDDKGKSDMCMVRKNRVGGHRGTAALALPWAA
jgi:hypothetical protein